MQRLPHIGLFRRAGPAHPYPAVPAEHRGQSSYQSSCTCLNIPSFMLPFQGHRQTIGNNDQTIKQLMDHSQTCSLGCSIVSIPDPQFPKFRYAALFSCFPVWCRSLLQNIESIKLHHKIAPPLGRRTQVSGKSKELTQRSQGLDYLASPPVVHVFNLGPLAPQK